MLNHNNPFRGYLLLLGSWISTAVAASGITIQAIPVIFSVAVSIMAIINYYYQIRNNKRMNKDHKD